MFWAFLLLPFFARFTDDYFYFSVFIIFRRLLLAMLESEVIVESYSGSDTLSSSSGSSDKLLLILTVLISAILLNLELEPYRFALLHKLDTYTMLVQALVAATLLGLTDAESTSGAESSTS